VYKVYLTNSLRALLLVVTVLIFLMYYLQKQPVQGLRAYVVLTGSMKPAISEGSLVVTKVVPYSSYGVGTIVAFPAPGRSGVTILHRVNQRIEDQNGVVRVLTKGDANSEKDSWFLNLALITGKEVVVVPWLGYLLHVLTLPLGFVITAILVGIFIVVPELKYLISLIQI
jgi:signal peptidase